MSHPKTSFAAASVSITALLLTGCATAGDDEADGEATFASAAEAQGYECDNPEPADTGVTCTVSCTNAEQDTLNLAVFESEQERDQHWSGVVLDREHWDFIGDTELIVGDDETALESVREEMSQ